MTIGLTNSKARYTEFKNDKGTKFRVFWDTKVSSDQKFLDKQVCMPGEHYIKLTTWWKKLMTEIQNNYSLGKW